MMDKIRRAMANLKRFLSGTPHSETTTEGK